MLIGWQDPELASFSSFGRFTILPISFPLLLEDPVRLIWGFGPEATYGGTIGGAQAAYSVSKIPDSGCVCQLLADLGVWCREPQTFRAMMEFGLVGSALYVTPLVLIWSRLVHQLKMMYTKHLQAMRLAFDGVAFLFIFVLVWYISVWRMDSFCFPFWFVAAAAYANAKASHIRQLEMGANA